MHERLIPLLFCLTHGLDLPYMGMQALRTGEDASIAVASSTLPGEPFPHLRRLNVRSGVDAAIDRQVGAVDE